MRDRRGKKKGKKGKRREGKGGKKMEWRESERRRTEMEWKGEKKKGRQKREGMGRKGRRFYFDQHNYIVVCSGTKTLKERPKPRFISKFSTLWGSCTVANSPIRFKFGIRKWFSGVLYHAKFVPDHVISSIIWVKNSEEAVPLLHPQNTRRSIAAKGR